MTAVRPEALAAHVAAAARRPGSARLLLLDLDGTLAPIALHAVWLYGYRVAAIAAVSFATAIAVEWAFERKRSGKISEAILVTAALYALAMPPRTPLWIVAVGVAFATSMDSMRSTEKVSRLTGREAWLLVPLPGVPVAATSSPLMVMLL